jgi:hypothetical protein
VNVDLFYDCRNDCDIMIAKMKREGCGFLFLITAWWVNIPLRNHAIEEIYGLV